MKESLSSLCESFSANIELIYKQKGFKLTEQTDTVIRWYDRIDI